LFSILHLPSVRCLLQHGQYRILQILYTMESPARSADRALVVCITSMKSVIVGHST